MFCSLLLNRNSRDRGIGTGRKQAMAGNNAVACAGGVRTGVDSSLNPTYMARMVITHDNFEASSAELAQLQNH
jgi:hypothetical protein